MDRNTPIVSQEESLLTPEEAWQDYESLKMALTEEVGGPDARQWLELSPHISALVRELVAACVPLRLQGHSFHEKCGRAPLSVIKYKSCLKMLDTLQLTDGLARIERVGSGQE